MQLGNAENRKLNFNTDLVRRALGEKQAGSHEWLLDN